MDQSLCTYGDKTLHGDERSLEVGADTDTCDGLVDDDLCPAGVRTKVDEETSTQGHHRHTEPDDGAVLTGLPDDDPRHNREDRKRNSSWEQINS